MYGDWNGVLFVRTLQPSDRRGRLAGRQRAFGVRTKLLFRVPLPDLQSGDGPTIVARRAPRVQQKNTRIQWNPPRLALSFRFKPAIGNQTVRRCHFRRPSQYVGIPSRVRRMRTASVVRPVSAATSASGMVPSNAVCSAVQPLPSHRFA